MVDVATPLDKSTVRIAGTRLRDIYQREITGQVISSVEWRDNHHEWLDAYRTVVETARPVTGAFPFLRHNCHEAMRYWLRLPLRNKSNTVRIVLGYDIFVAETATMTEKRIAALA
jgi:hypothetical protein